MSSPSPWRSILMTRAPRSQSKRVQYGPASTRVRSRMVTPTSGSASGFTESVASWSRSTSSSGILRAGRSAGQAGLTPSPRSAIVSHQPPTREGALSEEIPIQFPRFSAFYSPLIATIAGGFLKEEGLQPKHSNAPVGKSAIDGVVAGTVHVCQSAPSQGFGPLEKGQTPPAV